MWTGRAMFLSDFSPMSRKGRPSLPKIASRTVGRNADAAGLRERLEPRRDIDPVAVSAGSVVDDVAEIDADAQQHPPVGGNVEVALGHDLLDGDGAFDRAHRARELRHDAVAGDIDNRSAVLGDQRQDHRLVRFEIAHRLFFVAPHEARVAGDVRGQDGREPPFVNAEPSGASDMACSKRRLAYGRGRTQAALAGTVFRSSERTQWGKLPISTTKIL